MPQGQGFFAAAAEEERVAPLQAHRDLAPAGAVDQQRKYVRRLVRMRPRQIADANQFRPRPGEIEQPLRHELVVQDEVRFRQQFRGPEREQSRRAGAGADDEYSRLAVALHSFIVANDIAKRALTASPRSSRILRVLC